MATAEQPGYLLDTHTFLWLAAGDSRVPESLRRTLSGTAHPLWLSVASIWELAIKRSLGKLQMHVPLAELLREQIEAMSLRVLDLRQDHALAVEDLPFHHRDPFDRVLVAQAQVEDLFLVSRDGAFDSYPIRRIW